MRPPGDLHKRVGHGLFRIALLLDIFNEILPIHTGGLFGPISV